jgi:hypothetical protein
MLTNFTSFRSSNKRGNLSKTKLIQRVNLFKTKKIKSSYLADYLFNNFFLKKLKKKLLIVRGSSVNLENLFLYTFMLIKKKLKLRYKYQYFFFRDVLNEIDVLKKKSFFKENLFFCRFLFLIHRGLLNNAKNIYSEKTNVYLESKKKFFFNLFNISKIKRRLLYNQIKKITFNFFNYFDDFYEALESFNYKSGVKGFRSFIKWLLNGLSTYFQSKKYHLCQLNNLIKS